MKEGFTIIEELHLPSDVSSLLDVEALINKVSDQLSLQEEVYGNVLIAVTEAVNNAIIHGNGMKSEVLVELAIGDGAEQFCFKVKDCGNGFDYEYNYEAEGAKRGIIYIYPKK
jgi:serine/threonine-protein kinase RsbW